MPKRYIKNVRIKNADISGDIEVAGDVSVMNVVADNIVANEIDVVGLRTYSDDARVSPNIVCGSEYNSVADGISGASVLGGGAHASENICSANFATVCGGEMNSASGYSAIVCGGGYNEAAGAYSLAAGYQAWATHDGCMVWADSTGGGFESTAPNQVLFRADGGVGINTNAPTSALDVSGDIETDGGFYFGEPTADGTWRIVRSGDNLVIERRESGSWVTKQTITP